MTVKECAKLILQDIWKLHGLPSSIISDTDPVFTSKCWAELMGRLKVRLRRSTVFHPKTDGQTQKVEPCLVYYLRPYCNYEHDNLYDLLPPAEYAYYNSATTATQISRFYANYGSYLRTTLPVEKQSKNPYPEIMLAGLRVCMISTLSVLRKHDSTWETSITEPGKNHLHIELVMLSS